MGISMVVLQRMGSCVGIVFTAQGIHYGLTVCVKLLLKGMIFSQLVWKVEAIASRTILGGIQAQRSMSCGQTTNSIKTGATTAKL
jgi:hypothetical protein